MSQVPVYGKACSLLSCFHASILQVTGSLIRSYLGHTWGTSLMSQFRETPPPLGPPLDPRHGPTIGS